MKKAFLGGVLAATTLLLIACEDTEKLREIKKVGLVQLTFDERIYLENDNQESSRRVSIRDKENRKNDNSILITNKDIFFQELTQEITQYFVLETPWTIRIINKKNPIVNRFFNTKLPKYMVQTKNQSGGGFTENKESQIVFMKTFDLDALVIMHVEWSIYNKQFRFFDDNAKFKSEQDYFHWTERVGEPIPSELRMHLQCHIIGKEGQDLFKRTFIAKKDTEDISVVWSEVEELNASKSKWFSQIIIEMKKELDKTLQGYL